MTRFDQLWLQADRAIREQSIAADLRAHGERQWTADELGCPDVLRLAALMEELGEIARCVHDDHDRESLSTELAQLAGVALAWMVALHQYPTLSSA